MNIFTGPIYDDFESVVDTLDSTLVLDAVFYFDDGTNIIQAWAILNSGNGGVISVTSGRFDYNPPSISTFTTDFASAVQVSTGSINMVG